MGNHTFIIKGCYYGKNNVFPCLNDYIHACGRHPQVGAKMKRDYQMIASNAIRRQLGRLEIKNPITLHYKFYEGSEKRDFANVGAFAEKVIDDALQVCGVIKNDSQYWLRGYTHEFFVDKGNPRIVVEIEEHETEFGGV